MRTLVDIGDAEIKALDQLARQDKVSRASLIRKAVNDYLHKQHSAQQANAFGLWGSATVDGLAYQEEIRNEW